MRKGNGFTMVELLVVLAVVAMLLSIVAPRYLRQIDVAKEAALRENLSALRLALDQYYADKGYYPDQLDQLVQARYLRKVPVDPITDKTTTWQTVMVNEDGRPGIYDVKSGASGNGLDNTTYNSW